uniref:CUE domain-containing protein n=1 Tax=Aureoumbra lagunensis TaxID=44058 RepID=A0A7S3K0L7_9STRA|mmetsp:Transcript_17522/g.22853  ORF Transcript_17522/g.22853 Transcript_17522/m.22853 type:complete len:236 (+) Transcript_17522:57-764(+)
MASTSVIPTPRRKRGIDCTSETFYCGGIAFDCVAPPSKRIYRGDRRETYIKALQHLRQVFPDMDDETLRSVLDSCSDDVDAAIDKLTSLRIASSQVVIESPKQPQQPEEWVDALVDEMRESRDVPDARIRAARALGAFEQFILSRSNEKAEKLEKENTLLKRAVAIQAQRLQESRDDIAKLKREAEEQRIELKKAQLTNYSLSVHLRQSNFSHDIDNTKKFSDWGSSHHNNPDVF